MSLSIRKRRTHAAQVVESLKYIMKFCGCFKEGSILTIADIYIAAVALI